MDFVYIVVERKGITCHPSKVFATQKAADEYVKIRSKELSLSNSRITFIDWLKSYDFIYSIDESERGDICGDILIDRATRVFPNCTRNEIIDAFYYYNDLPISNIEIIKCEFYN